MKYIYLTSNVHDVTWENIAIRGAMLHDKLTKADIWLYHTVFLPFHLHPSHNHQLKNIIIIFVVNYFNKQ